MNFSHAIERAALVGFCKVIALAAATGAQAGSLINGDSLLVSTTTYEVVAAVTRPIAHVTPIPGGIVSDGNINTAWNDASLDGPFDVTSPITISNLSATSPKAYVLEGQA